MLDILKLLDDDTSGLSEEEKFKAEKFTDKLKELLIDELVKYETETLIEKLSSDKDEFRDSIEQMLVNGVKGLKNMNVKLLINIYLEKMGNESFIELIQNI